MRYATDWKEDIAPDEEARFAGYADEVAALQASRDAKHGSGRALHRKGVGGHEATFEVAADLPEVLRVGPFAESGARYRAYVRFSNGSWERQSDAKPDVRGMSVKLLGVGGKKVLTGSEDPRTQDFLLIRTSSLKPFRSPDEFMALVRAASAGSEAMLLPRLAWSLGPVRAFQLVRGLLAGMSLPFASYATSSFFTAAPIRFGATAARIALVPVSPVAGPPVTGAEGHAEDIARHLKAGPLAWELRAQLFQDERTTPIEDPSVDWTEEISPYATLGRLEIPAETDAEHTKRVAAYVERLSFDPWHAIEELRPIGAIMRARKAVYFTSVSHRNAIPEAEIEARVEASAG